ncbi:site-2 protease family protein [Sporosarcina sp. HYO08]|uniref:site-2 protease family protein n=1 Tax=Sporosarcina sp. HYO08 TaxID=1759557 RepID=UPI0007939D80|nr:site-2 protease family protein [Sporosarcina sp. HYO08]KXH87327.1 hypothetical protein AU377_01765 [Sporosarcina sp. HYO08]
MMKFRIHPVLLPVFIGLAFTGGLSLYAILFTSLLFHEFGHLLAAKFVGMTVRSCTIMPYGGEIQIKDRHLATTPARLAVALGGPTATALLLCAALLFKFPASEEVIRIQMALLAVNLLPILPLDGGQVLSALTRIGGEGVRMRTVLIVHSICFLFAAILILSAGLPKTLPYILLALFLLIQNISVFRFRKYEAAYLNLKLKRLT